MRGNIVSHLGPVEGFGFSHQCPRIMLAAAKTPENQAAVLSRLPV
jgi:hypothetical protein